MSKKAVVVGLTAGALLYLVHALLDWLFFYDHASFWGLLVWDVPWHEFVVRLTGVGLLTGGGLYVGYLFERLEQVRRREAHIKRVLLAIRNVNQLITHETDVNRLAEQTCRNLTETLGYYNAWIALTDRDSACVTVTASSGFNGAFKVMHDRLCRGEQPACMVTSLATDDVVMTQDPPRDCPDCPLAQAYEGRAGLTCRLAYGGRVYGLISVSVSAAFARDPESQALFAEVAGDLGFALDRIEQAGALARHRELLARAEEIAHVGGWELDLSTNRLFWSDEVYRILGVAPQASKPSYEAFLGMVHPEDRAALDDAYTSSIRNGSDTYEIEHRVLRPNTGEVRHLYEKCHHVRDDSGEVVRSVGMVLDITDRKQAEEALRRSQAMLARTEAIAHVGSWEWDIEADEITWSQELFRIYGRDPGLGPPTYSEHLQSYPPEDAARLREAASNAVGTGTPYELELRVCRPDGQVRRCFVQGYAEREPDGRVTCLYGFVQDLTEIREVENAYSRLCQMATEMICVADLATSTFIRVNPAFTRILGYTVEELTERPFLEFIHPDDLAASRAVVADSLQEGIDVISFDNRYRCKDGSYRRLEWNFHPVPAEGVIYAIAHDVTERRQAEQAFHDATIRLQTVVKAGNVGLWDWDLATDKVFYSAEWRRQIGYEEDEIADTLDEWRSRVHPDDLPAALERIQKMIESGASNYQIEFRFRHKDGSYRWILAQASVIADEAGRPVRVMGSHVDMTEQKKVEQALRESEHRFRSFVENANDIIYGLTPEGVFNYISPNWLQWMGEPAEAAIGRSFEPYVHPEDIPICRAFLESVLGATDSPMTSVEYRALHRDGSIRWHLSTGSPLRDETGQVVSYVGIARDVTERKATEEALRESEQKFKLLFETSPDAHVIYRDEGYQDCNESTVKLLGLSSREELLSLQPQDISPPYQPDGRPSGEKAREMIETAYANGSHAFEWTCVRREGRLIYLDIVLNSIALKGQRAIHAVWRDITARKRAEEELAAYRGQLEDLVAQRTRQLEASQEQLRRSERLASLGTLAVGIGHEINNPVGILMLAAQTAQENPGLPDEVHTCLDEIIAQVHRCQQIVRNLRRFARAQGATKVAMDFNHVVAKAIELARSYAQTSNCQIHFEPDGRPLPLVVLNETGIEQVLVNLIQNAAQAGAPNVRIQAEPRNGQVQMTLTDDGPGIDEAHKAHIFDPFFTTKQGTGTGLGLSIAHSIVQDHGGSIAVEDAHPTGCRFIVRLPAAD